MNKEKWKLFDRKKYLRRKKVFKPILNRLRINGCAICGSHKNLDFHHSNPTDKKFYISCGYARSNKTLSDELNKCILFCRKHHQQVEAKEKKGKMSKCKICTKSI